MNLEPLGSISMRAKNFDDASLAIHKQVSGSARGVVSLMMFVRTVGTATSRVRWNVHQRATDPAPPVDVPADSAGGGGKS